MKPNRPDRRTFAALLLVMTMAACGGGGADQAGEPDDSATPVGSERTEAPSGPAAATEIADLAANWDEPWAAADLAEDGLRRLLLDASGVSALVDDPTALLGELAAAQAIATDEVLAARGLDPTEVRRALSNPPPPVQGVQRVQGVQGDAATGGILALVTAMMAAYEPVLRQQPDAATGHLVDSVQVAATVPARSGPLTVTVDQSSTIDLTMCPDASGTAEGVVTVEVDLFATGAVDGEQVQLRATATFSIDVTVQSDAQAQLASSDSSLTGTVVSSGTGGDTAYGEAEGVGVSLGYDDEGSPRQDSATTHGQVATSTDAIWQGVTDTFVRVSGLLGIMHGTAASRYWQSGACIQLEATEPIADLTGGEAAQFDVRAVHAIDGVEVAGTFEAKPVRGTVEPAEAEAPATFTVTVAAGDADGWADVTFRSLRGIGRTDLVVPARGYRVELGEEVTLTGEKCGGPAGPWLLTFTGSVDAEGMSVAFNGTLTLQIAADLTGTYQVDLRGAAEGLPSVLSAALTFTGGGSAVFVDDPQAPRIDLLDGELTTTASGSGPDVSIDGIITQGPAGAASISVLRSACAS